MCSCVLAMKCIWIVFFSCLAFYFVTTNPTIGKHEFQADNIFLKKQMQVLRLFVRFHQPSLFKDIKDIGDAYKLEDNLYKYKNVDDVKMLMYLYNNNKLVPRGTVPTLFIREQGVQAVLMFEILYNAKDYDTFYKTACWYRDRVNELIYAYALSSAVSAREDTKYIVLPPVYESYPHMFTNEKVIQRAMDLYMTSDEVAEGKLFIMEINRTEITSHKRDPEQILSYFTEDVGLNAFNFYWHLQYPSWYSTSKYGLHVDRVGELFLHVQHQLLSRYSMERLSNYMEEVSPLDSGNDLPQFFPGLRFHNGETLTGRSKGIKARDTDQLSIHYMEELFNRIRKSIDRCFIVTEDDTKVPICNENGIDILGKILQSFGDAPNMKLYGSFYNFMIHVIGRVSDPEGELGVGPSALMMYITALRDPVYYQIIRTMYEELVYKLRKNLPEYTYKDLLIPGVKIDGVDIDELVTYYDNFYYELSNAFGVKTKDALANIAIRNKQQRLNHKPFTYRVNVTSDKDIEVLVTVFLLPVSDIHGREYDFETRVLYPVEIDKFPYKLTTGQTVIERNSLQSTVTSRDPDSYRTLFEKVIKAMNGTEPLIVNKYARPYGFPQRLLLPKGRESGFPLRLVVKLEPYEKVENNDLEDGFEIESVTMLGTPYGYKFPMANKMGVALYRTFRSVQDARVPNNYQKDVIIYHRSKEEVVNTS